MDKPFEVDDFVIYEDDNKTKHIGKIVAVLDHQYKLSLLNDSEDITCSKNEVHAIYTSGDILKSLQFGKEENRILDMTDINPNLEKILEQYRLNHVIISKLEIRGFFGTGFFVSFLANEVKSLKNYIVDNKFNYDHFHQDFPNVHNINKLLSFLKKVGFPIDSEEVIRRNFEAILKQ